MRSGNLSPSQPATSGLDDGELSSTSSTTAEDASDDGRIPSLNEIDAETTPTTPFAEEGRRTTRPSSRRYEPPRPTFAKRGPPSTAEKLGRIRTELVEFYTFVGLLAKPVAPLPALVVVKQAEACADAWVRAAEANPVIRRALEGFGTVSVYGTLIMAHFPIIIAVQVQLGSMSIQNPLAAGIRPEIELVIQEQQAAEQARQQAGVDLGGVPS